MATLEVHDAGHRVRRIRISRENPAMFGSDPMCDVVLDGPGVRPFHGRIRWKARRFKVDASPEVPGIEVNGRQVKSRSLYQGDEIRVGHCRIFLLSTEDGPDHGEKTVVREAPIVGGPALGRVAGQPPAARSRARGAAATEPPPGPGLRDLRPGANRPRGHAIGPAPRPPGEVWQPAGRGPGDRGRAAPGRPDPRGGPVVRAGAGG